MKRLVVVGTAWGDEGKGKITDFLSVNADITCRYQGGNNAGHSVSANGKTHYFQSLPSGSISEKTINLITNGCVVNPKQLIDEIKELDNPNLKLFISDKAHVIFPHHMLVETHSESRRGKNKLATTGKGIGPCYADKMNRIGMRMGVFVSDDFKEELTKLMNLKNQELKDLNLPPYDVEKLYEEYKVYSNFLKDKVINTSNFLNNAILKENKKVLFEGAQGVLLCIENGTYPFVTSSSPTVSSVPLNTGIAPWLLDGAIGVTKAYTSREGNGPMPTLITDSETIKIFYKANSEYEIRTKSYRRIGWFDSVILNHAKNVSGLSCLAVTVLDALTGLDEIKICTGYMLDGKKIDYVPSNINDFSRCEPIYIAVPSWKEDITNVKSFDELPLNAKNYLKKLEELIGLPVAIFSVGPNRNQTIKILDIF